MGLSVAEIKIYLFIFLNIELVFVLFFAISAK
jgi:hypothetical protein